METNGIVAAAPEQGEVGTADRCAAFAAELYQQVAAQARRRQRIEDRWYEDTRQYYGLYDEATEKRLAQEKGSSRLFVNLTRPKTRVMRARLNDILFPNDEPNWDIQATPVPEIEELAARTPESESADPGELEDVERAKAVRAEARKRADAMRMEIADQLEQSGYAEIGRRVVDQACMLGTGVAKGPFGDWRQRQQWSFGADGNGAASSWKIARQGDTRPAFEWVDLWNFFPDMDASSMEDSEFVFELHRMSRKALRSLAGRKGFLAEPIRELLREDPEPGEFSEYSRYLRAISDEGEGETEGRYNVFEYHGPIPAKTLEVLCVKYGRGDILETLDRSADPLKGVEGVVWFSHNRVLRFGIHHLDSSEPVYSIFRLDPQAAGLGGDGIPAMMRDPQAALNAAWRMTIENGGLSGVPMFIVDRNAIEPQDGDWSIRPRKVWLRNAPTERPPIEAVSIDGDTQALLQIIEMARSFSDDETNLPLIAQGDQGTHVTQTAHGMSLLVNAVNIIFRNAARSFDAEFTIPNIRRLYNWNMQFSGKEAIKGDMQVSARGSSVLLVRELQAQNLLMVLNLAATNPLLTKLIRVPALARRLFQALQLSKDKSNTGAATMSIDGKRGAALVEVNGAPLTTASIVSGWPVWAGYDGGKFRLLNSAKRIAATVIFVKAADNRTFEADEAITDFELPAATSGAAPYTYAVSGLPAGLTFNTATRMVSGTPTALAASTVTYTATDANSDTAEQTFEILIVSVLLNLPSAADLTLIIGRSYDIELPAATGGSAPYTYAVNGLPAGLGFDQTSRSVFGAPAEAGIFSFGTVAYSATDSLGQRSEHSFSIIVREASSLALPAIAVRGFTLNDPIAAFELPAATGGVAPYTYAVSGLPAGLVFDAATRRVSGTPTALGESTVTLTVTDADSETAEQTFVIVISAAGYRYVAVTADKDNISAAIVTGGTSAPGESTLLTLPPWSGNRYIVIAQLAAFPPLILISLGLGNSISAFTRAVGGVTIDGDSYDLWVSNDLQGDVISGGTLTVG